MKETLIIYRDWWQVIKSLPEDLRFKAFDTICSYAFEGIEPKDAIIAAVTALMRSTIDRDRAKYEDICNKRRISGQKGGAPKGNKNACKTIQNQPKQPKQANGYQNNQNQPKQPDNEYDNEYEYDNESSKEDNNIVDEKKEFSDFEKLIEKILIQFINDNRITLEGFCKNEQLSLSQFKTLSVAVLTDWSLKGWIPGEIKKGNGEYELNHLINTIRVKRQAHQHETIKPDKYEKRRGVDTAARSPEDYTGTL